MRGGFSRAAVLGAGVLIAGASVAACGTTAPQSTAGTSGTAATPGVTATTIRVTGLITKTSAAGISFSDAELGAKAYFDAINAKGGVDGRKIVYDTAPDDNLDPAKDASLARSLTLEDKYFAVVPVASPVFTAGSIFTQAKMPFFGWAITPSFCNTDYGFGLDGCVVGDNSDLVSTAPAAVIAQTLGSTAKGKTAAIIAEDTPAGTSGVAVVKTALEAAGFTVTYAQSSIPSGTVSDWTPYVHAVMTSADGHAPDVMIYGSTVPHVLGMRAAMVRAGYKGIQVDPTTYSPQLLQDAATRQGLQGEYVQLQFAPFEAGTPAMQDMLSALRAVGGAKLVPTELMEVGYWSAALFVAGLEKAGRNLTQASLVNAMNSNFTFGVDGGLGTVRYPQDHSEQTPCASLVQVTGASFTQRVPLTCTTDVPLAS